MHTQEDLNRHFETQLEDLERRVTAKIDRNPLFVSVAKIIMLQSVWYYDNGLLQQKVRIKERCIIVKSLFCRLITGLQCRS